MRDLISRQASRLDAFSVYPFRTQLPSCTAGAITGTPLVRPLRSSRTRSSSLQISYARDGYGPNCLTTFWTQLTYHFNGRTAQPLGPASAPGCDEPTSRCQTIPSIWTLENYQPVIPGVPFIHWSITFPWSVTGSLWSTYVLNKSFCMICQSYS